MPIPFRHAALAGAGTLAVLAGAAAPARSQGAPENAFAQARSDVRPDPALRFGSLPNGFDYVIARNDTPTGETSIRLRIGSGSLEEVPDQRGLAHFLEHMAFKGSARVPAGQLIPLLERRGLAFGPDTNASTGFTETVFMLDMPHSDGEDLDLGVRLMRDVAGSLTLSPAAMDAERGVVLSEERLRATPDYEVLKKRLRFLLPGQLAPERMVIGDVDVLKSAPVARLRSYYAANYRPDRATLVVVGDVDPGELEARIRREFADWRPSGAETPEPDLGPLRPRRAETQLIVQPGAHESLSLAWSRPFDPAVETEAKDRRVLIESLAAGVVRRRLNDLAHQPDAPFIAAGLSVGDEIRSARVTDLTLAPKPGQWRAALKTAVEQAAQAAKFGADPAEVSRQIEELRADYTSAAAGAATRRTPDIANEIVRALDEREVVTSPQQDLERFERNVRTISPADVDAALRAMFDGNGPLATLVLNAPPEGGEAALVAAFAADRAAPVVEPKAEAAATWPYTRFGTPSAVASRRTVADLGVTLVAFGNGVRLNLKPTTFRKDQVLVRVRLGRGRLELPRDRPNELWAASALISGGLKRASVPQMESALASRIYGASVGLSDDALVLGGATRPADLATQLQVLCAYLADPAFRPEAFDRVRAAFTSQLKELSATPEGVFARDGARLQHGGDPRWSLPTPAEVEAATLPELVRELTPFLKDRSLEVDVVGDIDPETVIREVGETFGALPARPAPDAPPASELALAPPPEGGAPIELRHDGRPDQAIAYESWPGEGLFRDPQRARATNVAAQVLENRLIDEVRIKEGATYSPSVASYPSDVFPDFGPTAASVEIPPARIAGFYTTLSSLASSLRTQGPTPDELRRAVEPRIATLAKSQQTNEYWLSWISGAEVDPRRLDVVRETLPGYRRLTAEDVRAAAASLEPEKALRIEIVPARTPPSQTQGR